MHMGGGWPGSVRQETPYDADILRLGTQPRPLKRNTVSESPVEGVTDTQ